MPYMGITLATMFTMLRLANEAKMRQVICGGKCPTWACRAGLIRVLTGGGGYTGRGKKAVGIAGEGDQGNGPSLGLTWVIYI